MIAHCRCCDTKIVHAIKSCTLLWHSVVVGKDSARLHAMNHLLNASWSNHWLHPWHSSCCVLYDVCTLLLLSLIIDVILYLLVIWMDLFGLMIAYHSG